MNLLSQHRLHNLNDEDWNAYGQITDIWTQKLGFSAKYTDLHGSPNSLSPNQELSFTETATLYVGARLWPGAEAYLVPEIIGEKALSDLHGLGGTIQNFELQKFGRTVPTPYLSRAYITQTIGLGGSAVVKTSDPQQIAHVDDSRRIVLRLGNFSVIDFFDKNRFGDLRRTFFNMAFLTYAAYDFAANARVRVGRHRRGRLRRLGDPVRPGDPSERSKPAGARFQARRLLRRPDGARARSQDPRTAGRRSRAGVPKRRGHGEVRRRHPRLRDRSRAERDDLHLVQLRHDPTAPDLCWARSRTRSSASASASSSRSAETSVSSSAACTPTVKSQVFSFTSTDRSISFGTITRGAIWKRPGDSVGIGWSHGWIPISTPST